MKRFNFGKKSDQENSGRDIENEVEIESTKFKELKQDVSIDISNTNDIDSLSNDPGEETRTRDQNIKEYVWMLWDGLFFFGFDDTKLARLNKGAKTSYLDKFKNKKWMGKNIIAMIVVLYVIASSASKVGTIKFQKIELTDQNHFLYPAKDVLTLNGLNFFYAD